MHRVGRYVVAALTVFIILVALTVCNVAAALPICNVVADSSVLKSYVIIRLTNLMNARPTSGAAASPVQPQRSGRR